MQNCAAKRQVGGLEDGAAWAAPLRPERLSVCGELGILKCRVSKQAAVRATLDSDRIQEGSGD